MMIDDNITYETKESECNSPKSKKLSELPKSGNGMRLDSWAEYYPYPRAEKENMLVNDGDSNEDEWELDSEPRGERWPPLGAPNDDENASFSHEDIYRNDFVRRSDLSFGPDVDRLKELEEEQEQLNSSLMALTSHFAQVQFRLKQIVDSSAAEKEKLLIELDEFANRGIPDLRPNYCRSPVQESCAESRLDIGQERQKELIQKLKQQLEDLEDYAYQTGEAELPQSVVLKKQRVIIDQLKGKLNLNMDNFDKLTIDDLKKQVDKAVKELINPLRMKEQLVTQLQTQIIDLERFIGFLQEGGPDPFPVESLNGSACKCEGHLQPAAVGTQRRKVPRRTASFRREGQKENTDRDNLIARVTTLLSMLSFVQLGCGPESKSFEKNTLKKTPTGYHWGDLRAALEVAIASVVDVAEVLALKDRCDAVISNESLTLVVRKKLSPALRELIQHGLMPVGQSQSLVPFLSCFPQRSVKPHKLMHAWDLILKYYEMKKGEEYNKTPARRLSQSFNLEVVGGSALTNRELMLLTIGNIISTHGPLKRSYDSHFKAFLSAALNKGKLVTWLRLIFRTQTLVENYYQSWGYVAKTGFEDSLHSLGKLNKFNFNLPVNLAIKSFHNITHVY